MQVIMTTKKVANRLRVVPHCTCRKRSNQTDDEGQKSEMTHGWKPLVEASILLEEQYQYQAANPQEVQNIFQGQNIFQAQSRFRMLLRSCQFIPLCRHLYCVRAFCSKRKSIIFISLPKRLLGHTRANRCRADKNIKL